MAFLSYASITNEVNTAYGVSTANTQVIPNSTQVSTASTQVSTANLSDATVPKAVNTARPKAVNTARPKAVNTARPSLAVVNAVRANQDNLVRGLPSKCFENDQTFVACLKGKQHKASSTKDDTTGILKKIITEIENLVDKKVGIRREFSVARTPQQNGVVERRNRTQIKVVKTLLADSKLPTTFWAEAVNTACYVYNKVLVVESYNKTLYELFRGRTPALSFMRPFSVGNYI
nr:hypothetical protein [Tanacetum cinerariifolium]